MITSYTPLIYFYLNNFPLFSLHIQVLYIKTKMLALYNFMLFVLLLFFSFFVSSMSTAEIHWIVKIKYRIISKICEIFMCQEFIWLYIVFYYCWHMYYCYYLLSGEDLCKLILLVFNPIVKIMFNLWLIIGSISCENMKVYQLSFVVRNPRCYG